jgi:hypothetical protein
VRAFDGARHIGDLSAFSTEDRERLVSCVNACEGINPEAVPEMEEALQMAARRISAMLDDRHVTLPGFARGAMSISLDEIRAALAKAKKVQ